MSSRPTMSPPASNVSKQVLVGYAYLEMYNPRATRIYVPGHPEDFVIPNIPSFNTTRILDTWVKFTVFTETYKLDPESPFQMISAPKASRPGTIFQIVERVDGVLKILPGGHTVTDPNNELGARGYDGPFREEMRLQVKGGLPNKPLFIVDESQPSLRERIIPKVVELPKTQTTQPSQGSRTNRFGRTPNPNPANNSGQELPRHLRPLTSRNSRPVYVYHPVEDNGHQPPPPPSPPQHRDRFTPSPPSQNLRPREYDDQWSSGRSSASSADFNSPPRHHAPSNSPPQNYARSRSPPRNYAPSRSPPRNYAPLTGDNQPPSPTQDREMADALRDQLKNPHFQSMLIAQFPDFISRLLTIM